MPNPNGSLCIIGDVHGHVQLALCMAALWQRTLGETFDAVFLCGDVGTFTAPAQLDSATRRHAKANPCELEFLQQWTADPQPPWLKPIFSSRAEGGLGLTCPVVMVHGNHEGFSHLASLVPDTPFPKEPIAVNELPAVDTGSFIRYLPTGWTCATPSGIVVGGVGGIARGQRLSDDPEMAYLNEAALLNVMECAPVDVLITHQGPRRVQGRHGAPLLDHLLDPPVADYWFHGHSVAHADIVSCGQGNGTNLVPLHDVGFSQDPFTKGDPGDEAWAWLRLGTKTELQRTRPDGWRALRQRKWTAVDEKGLVAPPLAHTLFRR